MVHSCASSKASSVGMHHWLLIYDYLVYSTGPPEGRCGPYIDMSIFFSGDFLTGLLTVHLVESGVDQALIFDVTRFQVPQPLHNYIVPVLKHFLEAHKAHEQISSIARFPQCAPRPAGRCSFLPLPVSQTKGKTPVSKASAEP